MDKVKEVEEKAPLKLKIVGSILNFVLSFIYLIDGTVNRKLKRYISRVKPACSKLVEGISTEDVVIDAANKVWVRVFKNHPRERGDGGRTTEQSGKGNRSNSEKNMPVIIFFHGGGFISFSADYSSYDWFCRQLARSCNAVVVSVNYRLAPEFPFPAAHDDCFKALEWIGSPGSRDHLPATADLSQSFLVGDSAGGNIVHFVGCRAAENDIRPIKLRGMVELQPFFGGEDLIPAEINLTPPLLNLATTHFMWRAFLPAGENRDHPACNVLGPDSRDISHLPLPPIMVVIGSLDILQERAHRYVEKLRQMGKYVTMIKYAGGDHGCYMGRFNSVTEECIADVSNFIISSTNDSFQNRLIVSSKFLHPKSLLANQIADLKFLSKHFKATIQSNSYFSIHLNVVDAVATEICTMRCMQVFPMFTWSYLND